MIDRAVSETDLLTALMPLLTLLPLGSILRRASEFSKSESRDPSVQEIDHRRQIPAKSVAGVRRVLPDQPGNFGLLTGRLVECSTNSDKTVMRALRAVSRETP
jgi:hypothetical protein